MTTVKVTTTIPEAIRDLARDLGIEYAPLLLAALVAEIERHGHEVPAYEVPRAGRPPREPCRCTHLVEAKAKLPGDHHDPSCGRR